MRIVDKVHSDFKDEVISEWGNGASYVLLEHTTSLIDHAQDLRPGHAFENYVLPLYVVTRCIGPTIAIETGTQNGGSAQAILAALDVNQNGKLWSFDSANQSTDGTHTLTHGTPGEMITPRLKPRWNLTIGFTYNTLKPLLNMLDGIPVDLFFHDSDHSKECVEFEFSEIVKCCARGSYVGMHDFYGQWDHEKILEGFTQVIGMSHPPVHRDEQGVYHHVLRLWRKD
jgi:hypothetical protein